MSQPTLSGMTAIDVLDLALDDAWGQNRNKWTQETLYAKEGTACNMTKFNVTGVGGGADNGVGGVNGNNNIFVGWCLAIIKGNIDTFANGGMRVNISSSATSVRTNYRDYYIGGNDVAWVGRGWRCVALDIARTADASGGTFSPTSVQSFGFGFNATGVNTQYPAFGIDMFWYGTGVQATSPSLTDATNGIDLNDNGASADSIDRNDGGSFITDGWEVGDWVKVVGSATAANDGEYEITAVAASTLTLSTGDFSAQDTANTTLTIICSITLEDIYQWDNDEANNTAPMRGVVDKDPGGAYIINYPLTIGDASGALDTYFRSTGDTIVIADQPLDPAGVDFIILAEDTGKTYLQIGGQGVSSSTISGQASIFSNPTEQGLDWDAAISGVAVVGVPFSGLEKGLTIANDANHSYKNCTFDSCGTINVGASAVFENNSLLASVGVQAMTFALGSTKTFTGLNFVSGGSGHALELTGTAYDITLSGVSFDGYASTDGSTGDEAIYVNIATGTVNITVSNGSDTPSIRTAGATVNIIANTVTVKVKAQTSAGAAISGARVHLQTSDALGPYPYQESVTIARSGSTVTVTHTAHGFTTGDKVRIEGATADDYNGVHTITVSDANTYTYTIAETPGTPDSGTASFVLLSGTTDGNGEISMSKAFTSDQNVKGTARKSSASPYYKPAPINDTVDSSNGLTTTAVLILDE